MYGIQTLGLRLRQMDAFHGTDLESLFLDALDDFAGHPTLDGVRLDDRKRPLGHLAIIAVVTSAGVPMNPTSVGQHDDPDVHKGAIEGDRPTDEQIGNPHGDGLDEEGLPDDPIATAEDSIGANEDESQG